MDFITQMYVPMVMAAALCVGYLMKKWIDDVDNKWIPTICCVLGAILACVLQRAVDVPTIVAGAVSGLGSTGLHQMFKQLIENDHSNLKQDKKSRS